MKKSIALVMMLCFALLSSCGLWYGIFDSKYAKLLGEWDVNLTTRPEFWDDTKYIFTDDKKLEIYHGSPSEHLSQKYDVDSVTDTDIILTVTYAEPDVEDSDVRTLNMAYVLSNGDDNLKVGFYTDLVATYYLDLTR